MNLILTADRGGLGTLKLCVFKTGRLGYTLFAIININNAES